MKKKNGNKKKEFQQMMPSLKKEIKDFLLSEEGRISKKNIAKMGISLAALSLMFKADVAEAGHSSGATHSSGSPTHTNFFTFPATLVRGGHSSNNPHTSHSNHGSHSSHGSHGQW